MLSSPTRLGQTQTRKLPFDTSLDVGSTGRLVEAVVKKRKISGFHQVGGFFPPFCTGHTHMHVSAFMVILLRCTALLCPFKLQQTII